MNESGADGGSGAQPVRMPVQRQAAACPCSEHGASLLAVARRPDTTGATLLRLQRQFGNQYVARVVDLARDGVDGTVSLDAVERSIEQARRGGQPLDRATQDRMGAAFGADFSAVRVHTDARSDGLNEALNAKAFATGQDVFFRQGQFDPGSTVGRELLAHELTHVVQQGGAGVRFKLTVSAPDDPQEVEADRMARAVIEAEHESPSTAADGRRE